MNVLEYEDGYWIDEQYLPPDIDTQYIDYYPQTFEDNAVNITDTLATSLPYVTATVFGQPCRMLIDTGASVSCINQDFWHYIAPPRHPVSSAPFRSVNGISGEPTPVFGRSNVPLDLDGFVFDHELFIIPINHDIILGQDFLKKTDAIINVQQDTITFFHEFSFPMVYTLTIDDGQNENLIPIKPTSPQSCENSDTQLPPTDKTQSSGTIKENYYNHNPDKPAMNTAELKNKEIIARSSKNIFLPPASYQTCDTYLSVEPEEGSSLLFDPLPDTKFNLVSPSVTESRSNHYPCIVHNPSDHPIYLPSKSAIAKVVIIDEINDFVEVLNLPGINAAQDTNDNIASQLSEDILRPSMDLNTLEMCKEESKPIIKASSDIDGVDLVSHPSLSLSIVTDNPLRKFVHLPTNFKLVENILNEQVCASAETPALCKIVIEDTTKVCSDNSPLSDSEDNEDEDKRLCNDLLSINKIQDGKCTNSKEKLVETTEPDVQTREIGKSDAPSSLDEIKGKVLVTMKKHNEDEITEMNQIVTKKQLADDRYSTAKELETKVISNQINRTNGKINKTTTIMDIIKPNLLAIQTENPTFHFIPDDRALLHAMKRTREQRNQHVTSPTTNPKSQLELTRNVFNWYIIYLLLIATWMKPTPPNFINNLIDQPKYLKDLQKYPSYFHNNPLTSSIYTFIVPRKHGRTQALQTIIYRNLPPSKKKKKDDTEKRLTSTPQPQWNQRATAAT